MATLPCELIEDILRRLPVKSLKRCRAVAKSWCFIIDSEKFVKSHLRQSLTTKSNRHLILGGLGLCSIDLGSLDKVHVIKPPFYYRSVDGINNSCNGIFLVLSDSPVLWNPFSREYKALPDCAFDEPDTLEYYSQIAYGFGYDSKNDDYKVVRVVECRHKRTHVWLASETKIYSLKSNSWRRIQNVPYQLPFLTGRWRVHINGALHTLVEDPDDLDVARIMAFSLETEKHYQVMMPQGIRIIDVDVTLDDIGGCLSVVCTNMHRSTIWIMKEYGVKESWVKLLSISAPAIEMNDFVKPLTFSRDGDKVLLNCDDKRLVWYDLRKKTVKNVPVAGLPFVFYAEVCVESLVSLNGQNEVKKEGKEKKKEKNRKKRDDFLSEGFKLVL